MRYSLGLKESELLTKSWQAKSKMNDEHVSASRQNPNGVFLARAPVLSEFLFFRNLNTKEVLDRKFGHKPNKPMPEKEVKAFDPLMDRSLNYKPPEEQRVAKTKSRHDPKHYG
uniref:Uncharacterized protein n=1 Tax=Candidatus Kentrum sp. UNK TaxID=2126344 RepID=A0A451A2L0_9GAMM|nr:MAG: hypothetical protein BECKUNK1418G_GA0071005_101021 [Candidatus Kentron sp. UNK]VFK68399.1 MAG: hypothetical protein BECKUNK1418H_GA0071006_100215 [Candidatus Kentron sp. UNK]